MKEKGLHSSRTKKYRYDILTTSLQTQINVVVTTKAGITTFFPFIVKHLQVNTSCSKINPKKLQKNSKL
jgi:hypothetical protein